MRTRSKSGRGRRRSRIQSPPLGPRNGPLRKNPPSLQGTVRNRIVLLMGGVCTETLDGAPVVVGCVTLIAGSVLAVARVCSPAPLCVRHALHARQRSREDEQLCNCKDWNGCVGQHPVAKVVLALRPKATQCRRRLSTRHGQQRYTYPWRQQEISTEARASYNRMLLHGLNQNGCGQDQNRLPPHIRQPRSALCANTAVHRNAAERGKGRIASGLPRRSEAGGAPGNPRRAPARAKASKKRALALRADPNIPLRLGENHEICTGRADTTPACSPEQEPTGGPQGRGGTWLHPELRDSASRQLIPQRARARCKSPSPGRQREVVREGTSASARNDLHSVALCRMNARLENREAKATALSQAQSQVTAPQCCPSLRATCSTPLSADGQLSWMCRDPSTH